MHIHAGAEELGRVYTRRRGARRGPEAACGTGRARAAGDAALGRWPEAAQADYAANLGRGAGRADGPLEKSCGPSSGRCRRRRVHQRRRQRERLVASLPWLPGLRHAGRTQLAPSAGAMGYGFPAAVAASLLEPHRSVVCFTGDGDFTMTAHEMATAIALRRRPGRAAGRIVVDNGSYGTIRMHQEREYPGHVSGSDC